MSVMDYRALIFLSILLSFSSWPVQAETDTVYISDVLRVGVRPQPNSRSTPIGVVITGMKLEVLDRRENFIRIRTEKGLTGWIKDIYAIPEPPAMIQLKELQASQATVDARLAELQQTVKVLEETNTSLNEELDQLKAERSKLQLRLARNTHNERQQGQNTVWWLIGLCVVAVAAFTGGIVWHRRQTTRRLGGLRL